MHKHFLFFLLICSTSLFGQYRFERALPEGLKIAGTAICMLQDQEGFIWIGSTDGLYRFDGTKIRSFRHQPGDSLSLPNNFVQKLALGPDGKIWVGTRGGMAYYSPELEQLAKFVIPTDSLPGPNESINSFCIDREGLLWVATQHGLYRCQQDGTELQYFQNEEGNPSSLPNNTVFDVMQDRRGRIWVATFNGLALYQANDTSPFASFLPSTASSGLVTTRFWAITEQSDGSIYLGSNHGVFRIQEAGDSIQLQPYSSVGEGEMDISGPFIQSINTDGPNRLWVGTWAAGLNELVTKPEQPDSFKIRHHLAYDDNAPGGYSLNSNKIMFTFRDRSRVLWVGTGSSLEKAAPYPWKFENQHSWPEQENSLSNNIIKAVLRDSQGNLWVGTRAGLNFLSATQLDAGDWGWQRIVHQENKPQSLSHNNVFGLYEDSKGAIWVSTYSGLNYLAPGQDMAKPKFQSFKVEQGMPDNWIYNLFEVSPGEYWLNTYSRLSRMSFDSEEPTRVRFRHFNRYSPEKDALANAVSFLTLRDRFGQLWVATAGGMSRCIDSSGTGVFVNYQHDSQNISSPSSDALTAAYQDSQSRIWVATRAGLNLLQQEHIDSNVYFRSWGIADGFRNDVIQSISEDQQGLLWLGTNDGLVCFDPEAALNGQACVRRIYDYQDGLASSSQVFRAAYSDLKTGRVYIGHPGGLSFFDPEVMVDNPRPPEVVLTELKILNEPVSPSREDGAILPRSITTTDTLYLAHYHNVMELFFAGLDYNRPEQNRYRYQLEGFDPDWVDAGLRNSATYTNLSAGWYCFKVKASNNDDLWNTDSRNLWIRMSPPPWRSWWAYLIYILLITGFIYGLIQLRIQRLREISRLQLARYEAREQVRKKNAEDFHDELGHRLTKISLYLELAKRSNQQNKSILEKPQKIAKGVTASTASNSWLLQEEMQKILQKIQEQTVALSTGVRDLIWNLDPSQDNLFHALIRLQEFGENLFEHSPTIFLSEGIRADLETISLSPEMKKHIPLLFKEAMHNCLKYASAKHAQLKLVIDGESVQLSFSDDGIGFIRSEITKGYGLDNMNKRADQIGGELVIKSIPQEGTTVFLKFKLDQADIVSKFSG